MRLYALLVFVIAGVCSLWAKPESEMPDTYAFNRGKEALDEGNYQEAMDWFYKELDDHPDNGYAYLGLTAINYLNEEYGQALSDVNNALKKLPKKDKSSKATAYVARAGIYLATQDTVRALEDYDLSLKWDPEDRDLFSKRAQLYYEMGKYDLSDADYRAILKLNEGDAFGYIGIGRNALEQQRYDDAVQALNKAVRLDPDYSEAYAFRAQAYSALEQWAEAIDDVIKAVSIDYNERAFDMLPSFPKPATDLCKQKLRIEMLKEPNSPKWPYCLATIENANEEYKEAITHYTQAYDIDANPLYLWYIAQCYDELRDYQKALDNVEKALAMVTQDYSLTKQKSEILYHAGHNEEAIEEIDKCIAQYPEYALNYIDKADMLMNTRRFAEAADNYNTATVIAPLLEESPYLLMKRGDAYRLSGKLGEAVADYQKLIATENDTTVDKTWLPFAYSALGNADKAIETMQQILDNDTTDVVSNLYNAACVYARLGRKEEAVKYLKEAIDNGYDDAWHIEIDYDLDSIRDTPGYKAISAGLAKEIEIVEVTESGDETQNEVTETVLVPFTKEYGVTKVKCTINDLPLHFIFDTGAAQVTMSMVEANFMLKNEYIKPTDIIGLTYYGDANGDIKEGTVINLRSVNFGGLTLENVRATVVSNQRAPLLLGQSVLGRLGKIEIDNPGMQLKITHKVTK